MILKLLFASIFFTLKLTSLGQSNSDQAKQQLVRELKKDLPDSTRQKSYYELAKLFFFQPGKDNVYLDSALYYLRKSIYLSDSTNPASVAITNKSLCFLGEIYFQTGNLDEGKKHFTMALNNYQKAGNKIKEAETWHRQGAKLLAIEADWECLQSSYEHAINIYTQLGNYSRKIDAGVELAHFHFRSNNSPLAEKELLSLIEESKKHGSYKLPTVYFNLAQVKRYSGVINEGLNYALNAVKSMEQNNDTAEAHNFYGELALEYQELDKPDESIYWYKKCIEERVKKNPPQYVIYRTTYLMVAQMIKIRKEKEALSILQTLEKSSPPDGPTESAILAQCLAYCYNTAGQYALAEKHFLSMVKDYSKEERNGEVLFIANCDIGKFYVSRQEYAKAEQYLQKAFALAVAPTVSRVKDLHLLMFKVDSANGHFTSAIDHFQKYKALNDSIFNQAKSKQIEELIIKYEVEKKDNDIKLFEKENKLQFGKLKQATDTRNWILGGVVLLLIIMSLLLNNSLLKQRANKKLQIQQTEIEKKNGALQHLVLEKEWLVKEIHHRVKNNFHIVMGLLGTQSQYLKTEEAIQAMAESQHRVHAMSLIHQKLYQSDSLSAINMTDYIHELVEYLRDSFIIRQSIQFNLQIDPINLNLSHCIPLGLVLNEAITNSIKYAFPDNKEGIIQITFKYASENHLLLTVKDNGIGLPRGFNIENSGSMGMKLMLGLSEDIDGKFAIIDHDGTEIKLEFIYDPDTTIGLTQMKSKLTNSI